jgi:hypothetical protein
MAHLAFHHGGQPGCRGEAKGAQQIVGIQIQIGSLHSRSVAGAKRIIVMLNLNKQQFLIASPGPRQHPPVIWTA